MMVRLTQRNGRQALHLRHLEIMTNHRLLT